MPTVAFPHDHSPQYTRKLDIDGAKAPYNDQSVWAGIATLDGLPSTSAPIGRSDDDLPIGVIGDRRRPPQHPFKYLPRFRSSLAPEGDAA